MNNKDIFALETPRIISQSFSATPAIGQCDACSPIVFAEHENHQIYLPHLSYYRNPEFIKQTVDSNHSTVVFPIAKTFSVLNKSALNCLQHFSSPKTLEDIPSVWPENWGKSIVQSRLDQMITLDLLVPEGSMQNKFYTLSQTEVRTPVEVPNTLAVWLHITGRCNLRCTYCYLSHDNADMSLETGRAAVEVTIRSAVAHHYREVKFKYAGGEPLLRFPFITELHQYARALAEQYGLELDGVVLSNGTLLTKEMVKRMQALGLRLMISLDNIPPLLTSSTKGEGH